MVIKAQALAGIFTEFTMTNQDPEVDYWMVYADGLSAASVGGVGVIILKHGVQL